MMPATPRRPSKPVAIAEFPDGRHHLCDGKWITRPAILSRSLPKLIDVNVWASVCVLVGDKMVTYEHASGILLTFEEVWGRPGMVMECSIGGIVVPNSTPVGKAPTRIAISFKPLRLPPGALLEVKRPAKDLCIGRSVDLEGDKDATIDGILRPTKRGKFQLNTEGKISIGESAEKLVQRLSGSKAILTVGMSKSTAQSISIPPGIWLMLS